MVRRNGAFAVLKYHHSDTDASAPIQYIIRFESVRLPQDLTDTAFGAAGSIRNWREAAVRKHTAFRNGRELTVQPSGMNGPKKQNMCGA